MPTITVLDDEPEVLKVLDRLLRDQGWNVFTASNPKDALAMLQQHTPDAVITDIRMPGLSGIDILHQVKLLDPLTEVVLMTGHASIETAIQGLNEGAFAYLRKPFESLSLVVTTVARALEKRRVELRNRELVRGLEQALAEIEDTNRELLSAHLEFLTLAKLVDVGRQLITITDVDSMLRFAAHRAREVMRAEACVIWLRGDGQRKVYTRAATGIPGFEDEQLRELDNAPVALRAIDRGVPFAVRDIDEDESLALPECCSVASVRGLFAAPLNLYKEPQGALVVYISDDEEYRENDSQVFALLASQVSAALESSILYHDLEQQYLGTVTALSTAVEARDPYTSGHSRRVARYAVNIAKHMGLGDEEVKTLHWGALLHDIGKIGIPDEILKKPGPLTDLEWATMRQHPVIGSEILRSVPGSDIVLPMVLHHHERIDGTGYPDGLQGEEIPLLVRLLSVADGFEAMTSRRSYRSAMSMDKALATLRKGAGSQWDAEGVKALHSFLSLRVTRGSMPIGREWMSNENLPRPRAPHRTPSPVLG
jgi:putative nucleotidyltransferase with HDIG domain